MPDLAMESDRGLHRERAGRRASAFLALMTATLVGPGLIALLSMAALATPPPATEDYRRLSTLTARVNEREDRLRSRLATLYRLARGGLSRSVVSGEQESAFVRLSLLSRVVQRDLFEISELARERDEVLRRVEQERSRSREAPDPSASVIENLRGQLPAPLAGSAAVATLGGLSFQAGAVLEVRAVAPGRVVFAAPLEGFDNMVLIDHGGGDTSLYAQLGELTVSEGQRVGALEEVGRLRRDGALYFELRRGAELLPASGWLRR